jgi:hypothetical protein
MNPSYYCPMLRSLNSNYTKVTIAQVVKNSSALHDHLQLTRLLTSLTAGLDCEKVGRDWGCDVVGILGAFILLLFLVLWFLGYLAILWRGDGKRAIDTLSVYNLPILTAEELEAGMTTFGEYTNEANSKAKEQGEQHASV